MQWRTDNTMEDRKRTNNDLQSTTQKTKKRLKIPKGVIKICKLKNDTTWFRINQC